MPDGGGRNAEAGQIIEPGNASSLPPDPRIVEDGGGNAQLRREIGGIDAAVRSVDDDRARRLSPDAGDAVGGQHRRKLFDSQQLLPGEVTLRSCRESQPKNSRCFATDVGRRLAASARPLVAGSILFVSRATRRVPADQAYRRDRCRSGRTARERAGCAPRPALLRSGRNRPCGARYSRAARLLAIATTPWRRERQLRLRSSMVS